MKAILGTLSMVGMLVACGRPQGRGAAGSAMSLQVQRTGSASSLSAPVSVCSADFVAKFYETQIQMRQMQEFRSLENELHFAKLCGEFVAFNISSCHASCDRFRNQSASTNTNNTLAAIVLCPTWHGRLWSEPAKLIAACASSMREIQ